MVALMAANIIARQHRRTAVIKISAICIFNDVESDESDVINESESWRGGVVDIVIGYRISGAYRAHRGHAHSFDSIRISCFIRARLSRAVSRIVRIALSRTLHVRALASAHQNQYQT